MSSLTFPIHRRLPTSPNFAEAVSAETVHEHITIYEGINQYDIFEQFPKDLRDAMDEHGGVISEICRHLYEGVTVEDVVEALQHQSKQRQQEQEQRSL